MTTDAVIRVRPSDVHIARALVEYNQVHGKPNDESLLELAQVRLKSDVTAWRVDHATRLKQSS